MQKFIGLEQMKEGKLYTIETQQHQRLLVIKDKDGIRTNAQEIVDNKMVPVRRITETEVISFEEIQNS